MVHYINGHGSVHKDAFAVVPEGRSVGIAAMQGTKLEVFTGLSVPNLDAIEHMTWYCEYDIMPYIIIDLIYEQKDGKPYHRNGETVTIDAILKDSTGPIVIWACLMGGPEMFIPVKNEYFSRYWRGMARDIPGLTVPPYELLLGPRIRPEKDGKSPIDPVYFLHPQLCPKLFVEQVVQARKIPGCCVIWVQGSQFWIVYSGHKRLLDDNVSRVTGLERMERMSTPLEIDPRRLSRPAAGRDGGYGLIFDIGAFDMNIGSSLNDGVVLVMEKIRAPTGEELYSPVWHARDVEPARGGGRRIFHASILASRGEVYVGNVNDLGQYR